MKFLLVIALLVAPAFARVGRYDRRWAQAEVRMARREMREARAEIRRSAAEARREAREYRNQLRRELRSDFRDRRFY